MHFLCSDYSIVTEVPKRLYIGNICYNYTFTGDLNQPHFNYFYSKNELLIKFKKIFCTTLLTKLFCYITIQKINMQDNDEK